MKKLLVTAIGAAAALGAYATDITTQLRFENMAEGETTVTALNTEHAATYWSEGANATNTYTVEARTAEIVAKQTAISGEPHKALSVKTTFGKPLSVNVVAGGAATAIGTEGIYFDSLVKFTVCEDTPDQEYEGAKIVMWLQEQYDENDNVTGTNLYVKAGYLTGSSITNSSKVYRCDAINDGSFADKFHRVTIKAIDDITESSETVIPGFAIYIDGNDTTGDYGMRANAPSEAKWDADFSEVLTEAAKDLNDAGALFPSMIQQGEAKTTLTAASFDGTGSLTDIIITNTAPKFAKDYVATKATVWNGNEGSDPVPYTTLEEALNFVNGETSGTYTFKLAKGMDISAPLAFTSSADVILDFAGLVITNTAATAAISNNGKLTITNSTVAVGGVYCSGEGAALVSGPKAYYTYVRDGCFWGAVSEQGLGALLLYGGSYAANTMTGSLAPGKVFSAQGATYQGLYDVIDAPTTYTVRFFDDVEGQVIGEAQSVESGALAVAPAAPTKAGYTFVDWTPSTNVAITADTDFYPTWTANNYNITYYDGESALDLAPATYTFGTGVTLPASAGTKAGYDFAGWYDNAQFTGEAVTAVAANATGDKTFYAKYTAHTYTITYKEPDGTTFERWADQFSAPATFTVESVVTLPVANNVNLGTGGTFNGWTNAVGDVVTTTENLTADLEVFAKITAVVQPTYPSYLDNADATVKGQYNTWKAANNVADGNNDYEAAFLLNVAPDGDTTLDTTAVTISGTTVTITLDHATVNGYPYVKKAATVAGLATATAESIAVGEGGVVTLSNQSGDAAFYQVGISVTPVEE